MMASLFEIISILEDQAVQVERTRAVLLAAVEERGRSRDMQGISMRSRCAANARSR